MGHANGPRVAVYSQDSLGLGHLRRTITIGGHFLEKVPGSKMLLFSRRIAPCTEDPEEGISQLFPDSRITRHFGRPGGHQTRLDRGQGL